MDGQQRQADLLRQHRQQRLDPRQGKALGPQDVDLHQWREFRAVRADVGDDPENPDVNIAWKYVYTAKDTWLGPTQTLGELGALYNLTMDPYEKYDMFFNGAVASRT